MPYDKDMLVLLSGSGFITTDPDSNIVNAEKAFFVSRVYDWLREKINEKAIDQRAYIRYIQLLRLYKKGDIELSFVNGELYVKSTKRSSEAMATGSYQEEIYHHHEEEDY